MIGASTYQADHYGSTRSDALVDPCQHIGKGIQTHLLLPIDRFPPAAEMVIKDGPNKIGNL